MRNPMRWVSLAAALAIVLAASPAAAATPGTYDGDTSQGLRFTLIVGEDHRLKDVETTVEYENDVCIRDVTWEFGLDVNIRDDGTFHVRLADDRDERDTLVVKGAFASRRKAEGTFRGTFSDGGNCNDLTAKGTWVATRD